MFSLILRRSALYFDVWLSNLGKVDLLVKVDLMVKVPLLRGLPQREADLSIEFQIGLLVNQTSSLK